MTESQRVEPRWRSIKEGEVSPYKVIVCLFIRENFLVNPLPQANLNSSENDPTQGRNLLEKNVSPKTLLLIYKLISTTDMSFQTLKALIEDPASQVRAEVLRKFTKIVANLEESSVGFLYELFHSVIDIKSSNIVILRKKVEKSSPFGKFLRTVLMNIRRMSYPQVHYLYKNLCSYVGDYVKTRKKSLAVITAEQQQQQQQQKSAESSDSVKQKSGRLSSSTNNPLKFRGLEIFQRMTERNRKSQPCFNLFENYVQEYKKATTGKNSVESPVDNKHYKVMKALESKSLRNLWNLNRPFSSGGSCGAGILRTPTVMDLDRPAAKRRTTPSIPTRQLPPRSPKKSKSAVYQQLVPVFEHETSYFPEDNDEDVNVMGPPLSTVPSPRSASRKAKLGAATSSSISPGPSYVVGADGESGNTAGSSVLPASKNYEKIRFWSRKQIEKALKGLADELVNCSKFCYSTKEVSEFIEMIVLNPSAQILLSQIYFIEYLNCVRLKDLRRCSEALRTSFDIRIKPNTSELNKGVPYAPYNFAVFYHFMGYKTDAIRCLEEAFRAGHAAADTTCLHYCHNLWSTLQNKPYTDAIVTVTKEVDNNMAYLHSLNVISNAHDYYYRKQVPEEVLYTLWHYNSECGLEEMESLLLSSLSTFFMAFGWHEVATFPAQIILNSRIKWPLAAYSNAIVVLSDNLLFRGEIDIATDIMNHGNKLFSYDGSSVGETFCLRHAVFQAFKSFLAYEPVSENVLSTLYSFSMIEGCYWLAYSKMILNEWEEASNLVNKLSCLLNESSDTSCEKNDMKMRTLLLMGELQCLNGAPAAALKHIFEALEIAYAYYADHYITLCLTHIASIQCHLSVPTAAVRTVYDRMRSSIRSSNVYLDTRIDMVSCKITIALQAETDSAEDSPMIRKIQKAQKTYSRWGNNYRIKEAKWIHIKLLEKSGNVDIQRIETLKEECKEIDTTLYWSQSTCLM